VCEEIVEEDTIRDDPNRTIIPGLIVDAVVKEPFGCHPSFAQGYYDRDNRFYLDWEAISRDPETLEAWLKEWVYEPGSHAEYLQKLGSEHLDALRPGERLSGRVNYGEYG
jgi:glutaconate CoA-transferase subunit A